MSKAATATVEEETVETERTRQSDRAGQRSRPKKQPRYHVVLWDDDDHSYDYVIRMMRELFGHTVEFAYQLACEVDNRGRTICLTTTLEHAELKRDQIHAYGKDRLIASCAGSMSCSLEAER